MRLTACALVAFLVLGTAGPAPSTSSPISASEAPPIESEKSPLPEVDTVRKKEDVTPFAPAEVRDAVQKGDYERALSLLRRELVRGIEPSAAAELRIVEARVLVRMGDALGAAQSYRRALDDPVQGMKARTELHDLLVGRGRFSQADRLTAPEVIEEWPGSRTELARMRAYSMSVQGRHLESARLVADASITGDPEARVLRANALLVLGDHQGAEQLYLKVLQEPASAKVRQIAHFGLGQVARLRGGRAHRALQDEKAAQLGAAPWAELDWGLALRALGRREGAREKLDGVAESYPPLAATARLALGRLDEEEGDVERSLEHLAASLEGTFGDFLAYTRLGQLLLQEGDDDAGIQLLHSALELFPDFPPAREELTRALSARGRWEEVPEGESEPWDLPGWTWDRLMDGDLPYFQISGDRGEIAPDDPRRIILVLVHLRGGFPAASLGWTEDVPVGDSPHLDAIRAEALEQVGRENDARDLWQAVLESSPSTLAYERLARLVFDADPEKARDLWQAAFQQDPQNARVRIRMAEILEDAGMFVEAKAAYEEARQSGWLSVDERRRVKLAVEDLEEMIEEEMENP